MSGIDPHLMDVCREGHYWTKAPRIDAASLDVARDDSRRWKPWAPSIYDDKLGVVAERPAPAPRGGS